MKQPSKRKKNALIELLKDDVRRARAFKIAGFITRNILAAAVMVMLWLWLNIPGETEHQIYLLAGLFVLSGGLAMVNLIWFKG